MAEYTAQQIAQAAKAALEQGDTERAQRLIAYGKTLSTGQPRVAVSETPDGRSVAPDTTAEEAAKIPPGMVFDPRTGGYVDTALAAERLGKSHGFAASYLAGTPFIGESVDEFMGAVGGALGENPEIAQETMRQSRQQFQESNAGLALGAELAGGIVGSLPFAAGGAGFVSRGKNLLDKGLRGLAVATPLGAADGLTQGYGSGTTAETRESNAQSRALLTGGLSAVLGAAAPTVGAGVSSLARNLKALDVKAIASTFGISAPAARIVKQHLINDDLDAAALALSGKGDDALLAEAGPSTMQLLDTTMSGGGRALTIGRERVSDRLQGAASNWTNVLNSTLGTATGGIRAAGQQMRQASAPQRKAAYDFAYRQPTPMAGPGGAALQSVLNRITPKNYEAALEAAAEQARDDGYMNMNLLVTVNPDGSIRFSQPPSVMDLDYLARGLNALREKGVDAFGRVNSDAKRLGQQAKDLRNVLKTYVPGYSRAVKLGKDNIAEGDALVMGRTLLSSNTTREDVVEIMRGATDGTKAAMARGIRENIEAISDRARATIRALEDGSIDFDAGTNAVGEAVEALRAMATPGNIKKLRIALGKDSADALFAAIKKQGDAMVLGAAVARNSATAIRTAGQEAIAREVGPGVLRSMAGEVGSPLEALRPLTRGFAGTSPASLSRAKDAYFTEIADVLTRMKGPEARQALSVVKAAMQGQPTVDAQLDAMLTRLGIPTFAALHQLGVQTTAP